MYQDGESRAGSMNMLKEGWEVFGRSDKGDMGDASMGRL